MHYRASIIVIVMANEICIPDACQTKNGGNVKCCWGEYIAGANVKCTPPGFGKIAPKLTDTASLSEFKAMGYPKDDFCKDMDPNWSGTGTF